MSSHSRMVRPHFGLNSAIAPRYQIKLQAKINITVIAAMRIVTCPGALCKKARTPIFFILLCREQPHFIVAPSILKPAVETRKFGLNIS